jgi:hypothetical protein
MSGAWDSKEETNFIKERTPYIIVRDCNLHLRILDKLGPTEEKRPGNTHAVKKPFVYCVGWMIWLSRPIEGEQNFSKHHESTFDLSSRLSMPDSVSVMWDTES